MQNISLCINICSYGIMVILNLILLEENKICLWLCQENEQLAVLKFFSTRTKFKVKIQDWQRSFNSGLFCQNNNNTEMLAWRFSLLDGTNCRLPKTSSSWVYADNVWCDTTWLEVHWRGEVLSQYGKTETTEEWDFRYISLEGGFQILVPFYIIKLYLCVVLLFTREL